MDQGLAGRPGEECADDVCVDDIREGVASLREPTDVTPQCNTLGVWLPHLHLHFMNMSIMHPFVNLYHMKHDFKTLQHIVYFMCIVSFMNVKCATLKCNMCHSLSETRLVSTMQQDHETCET